jgi:hypothetical protein
VAGSCEHGNKLSIYIKGEEFLEQMGDFEILKKSLLRGVC